MADQSTITSSITSGTPSAAASTDASTSAMQTVQAMLQSDELKSVSLKIGDPMRYSVYSALQLIHNCGTAACVAIFARFPRSIAQSLDWHTFQGHNKRQVPIATVEQLTKIVELYQNMQFENDSDWKDDMPEQVPELQPDCESDCKPSTSTPAAITDGIPSDVQYDQFNCNCEQCRINMSELSNQHDTFTTDATVDATTDATVDATTPAAAADDHIMHLQLQVEQLKMQCKFEIVKAISTTQIMLCEALEKM